MTTVIDPQLKQTSEFVECPLPPGELLSNSQGVTLSRDTTVSLDKLCGQQLAFLTDPQLRVPAAVSCQGLVSVTMPGVDQNAEMACMVTNENPANFIGSGHRFPMFVRPNAQASFTFSSDTAGCNQDVVEVSCNAAGITTSTNVNVNCLSEPSSLTIVTPKDTTTVEVYDDYSGNQGD